MPATTSLATSVRPPLPIGPRSVSWSEIGQALNEVDRLLHDVEQGGVAPEGSSREVASALHAIERLNPARLALLKSMAVCHDQHTPPPFVQLTPTAQHIPQRRGH